MLPDCQIAIDVLIDNTDLLTNKAIIENPNCFVSEIHAFLNQNRIEKSWKNFTFGYLTTADRFEFKIKYPTYFDNSAMNILSSSSCMKIDSNITNFDWTFIGFSIDHQTGKGNMVLFTPSNKSFLIEKQFDFPVSSVSYSNEFEVIVVGSQKQKNDLFFTISQLNFYSCHFARTYFLAFYASSSFATNKPMIAHDIVFASQNSINIQNLGVNQTDILLNESLEQRKNGVLFKSNSTLILEKSMQLNDKYSFLNSPTLYFQLEFFTNFNSTITIFETSEFQNESHQTYSMEINLKSQIDSQTSGFFVIVKIWNKQFETDTTVFISKLNAFFVSFEFFVSIVSYRTDYFQIVTYLNKQNVQYSTLIPGIFKLDQTRMSLKNMENRKQTLTQKQSEEITFYSVDNIGLSSKNEKINEEFENRNVSIVVFQRFALLASMESLIAELSSKAPKQKCRIELLSSSKNTCFICHNSVLFRPDGMCIEFCAPGSRSIGGVCVPCQNKNCEEIWEPIFNVESLNSTSFNVTFNKEIPSITKETMSSLVTSYITNTNNLKLNQTQLDATSNLSFILNFNINQTIVRPTLKIEISQSTQSYLFDSDGNFVYDSNFQISIDSIVNLSFQQELAIKILAYCFVILFYLTVFLNFGLFLFCSIFNVQTSVLKQTNKTLIIFQIMILILHLNFELPLIFQKFLAIVHQKTIGIYFGFYNIKIDKEVNFVNFTDNSFSSISDEQSSITSTCFLFSCLFFGASGPNDLNWF